MPNYRLTLLLVTGVAVHTLVAFVLGWMMDAEDIFVESPPEVSWNDGHWLDTTTIPLETSSSDKSTDPSNHPLPRVEVVVIAGAWRRPNGTLSKAFEVRIIHGLRTALLLGAKHVLFTGGLDDSTEAMRFAENLTNFTHRLFPMSVARLPAPIRDAAGYVKSFLEPLDAESWTLGRALEELRSSVKTRGEIRIPQFHTENVSVTTFTNAVETQRFLARNGAYQPQSCNEELHMVVVSSKFHARRCQLLFTKVLHTPMINRDGGLPARRCARIDDPERKVIVHVTGTSAPMLEFLTPVEWMHWADQPPPSLSWAPAPLGRLVNSMIITYRSWGAHTRVSMLSWEWYSLLREAGAFAKALAHGSLSLFDLIQGRGTAAAASKRSTHRGAM